MSKKEFFNDFIEFFKSCNVTTINMKVFEEIKNYIDLSILLIIIELSIKIGYNIIYSSYDGYKHIKIEIEEGELLINIIIFKIIFLIN